MKHIIQLIDEAEQDLDEAFIWYEMQSDGLGLRFIQEVDSAMLRITGNPKSFPNIYKNTRRYLLNKFPYGVYYQINDNATTIKIIAILHFRRDPKRIEKRGRK